MENADNRQMAYCLFTDVLTITPNWFSEYMNKTLERDVTIQDIYVKLSSILKILKLSFHEELWLCCAWGLVKRIIWHKWKVLFPAWSSLSNFGILKLASTMWLDSFERIALPGKCTVSRKNVHSSKQGLYCIPCFSLKVVLILLFWGKKMKGVKNSLKKINTVVRRTEGHRNW